MPSQEKIAKRFDELADQVKKIRLVGREHTIPDRSDFYAWASSVLNLLKGAFGEQATHFGQFAKQLDSLQGNYVSEERFGAFRGLFLGAK